jgi:hypothetical protein
MYTTDENARLLKRLLPRVEKNSDNITIIINSIKYTIPIQKALSTQTDRSMNKQYR